ncbi:hypothetical protein ACO0LL_13900 [Undibacterium sp. TC4M20W]|uniref:hypothetical protein n=1 Tax=Undibacterium sp. TC4M20W TaxID=3413052 RepID=UPI003BF26E5A
MSSQVLIPFLGFVMSIVHTLIAGYFKVRISISLIYVFVLANLLNSFVEVRTVSGFELFMWILMSLFIPILVCYLLGLLGKYINKSHPEK